MEHKGTDTEQLPGDTNNRHSLIPDAETGSGNIENDSFENNDPSLDATEASNEITNNDGSVIETLDTAFHNVPGDIKEHSIAGSNRQEYYEARSQGKSDTDEEQDFLRNKQS